MMPETREAAKHWAMEALKPTAREACGLVIIEKGKEVFVPCRNISELQDAFVIDPIDFANAEDRGEIVRIIHSHPYSSPLPSEPDKVSCEASGLPWSIVSVPNGDWYDFSPTGYKAPLVGRYWLHGVLDCYSLVRDYYKEILGIDLPDFDRDFEWWLKGENLYLNHFGEAGFYEVPLEDLREHDVIFMQVLSPVINHASVYRGNDRMIHHLHRRLSSHDIYSGYWRKHTVKVVRHKLCA